MHAVAWSELNPNQVASGGGDGSVKLWDMTLPVRHLPSQLMWRSRLTVCPTLDLPRDQNQPVAHWLEHKREVMSVDWSSLRKEQFVSSSWDGSLKLVSPVRLESEAHEPS